MRVSDDSSTRKLRKVSESFAQIVLKTVGGEELPQLPEFVVHRRTTDPETLGNLRDRQALLGQERAQPLLMRGERSHQPKQVQAHDRLVGGRRRCLGHLTAQHVAPGRRVVLGIDWGIEGHGVECGRALVGFPSEREIEELIPNDLGHVGARMRFALGDELPPHHDPVGQRFLDEILQRLVAKTA